MWLEPVLDNGDNIQSCHEHWHGHIISSECCEWLRGWWHWPGTGDTCGSSFTDQCWYADHAGHWSCLCLKCRTISPAPAHSQLRSSVPVYPEECKIIFCCAGQDRSLANTQTVSSQLWTGRQTGETWSCRSSSRHAGQQTINNCDTQTILCDNSTEALILHFRAWYSK